MRNLFKNFNFQAFKRDKRAILPLLLLLPTIFIIWQIVSLIQDMPTSEESSENEEQPELVELPSSTDDVGLKSRQDLFSEVYKDTDYTAIRTANEEEERAYDNSSVYTQEEINLIRMIESQYQKKHEDTPSPEASSIEDDYFQSLQQPPPSRNNEPSKSTSPESSLIEELRLYQKFASGEPILTPEEEALQKEEFIRMDERQKILEEINRKSLSSVSATPTETPQHFNSLSKKKSSSHKSIRAMVDQTIVVKQGSRIRLILLDDIFSDNTLIQKGTYLYAQIESFSGNRVGATIRSIITPDGLKRVNLSVFDYDGQRGFYVPNSDFGQTSKEIGASAMQGVNTPTTTPSTSVLGMAVQGIQQAASQATNALSNKIREQKATIKYNSIIYIVDNTIDR